jgi:hypothetical protein
MKIDLSKWPIKVFSIIIFMLGCITVNAQTTIPNNTDSLTETAENIIEIKAEVNYLKHYLWRSILFGSDDVSQPFISITYKNIFVNFASNINYIPKNLPTEQYKKKVAYDEQDLEFGYAGNIKKLDFEIKADAYLYFYQPLSPSTAELNLKLIHPIYKNISAFSENVIDIAAYNGAYYNNTGLMWDYTKAKTNIVLQTSVGLANSTFYEAYFGTETNAVKGILFGGAKAELTQNFKSFYLKIMGEYELYTKKEIKDITERNNVTNVAISIGKDLSIKLKK